MKRAEAFRIHGGREWLTRSDHMVLEVELGEDKEERAALRETVSGEAFLQPEEVFRASPEKATGRRIARGLRQDLIGW